MEVGKPESMGVSVQALSSIPLKTWNNIREFYSLYMCANAPMSVFFLLLSSSNQQG